MGKRDLASFLVILAFSASLAATSKPKGDDDEHPRSGHNGEGGFKTASADVDGGDAAAMAMNHDAAADAATATTKRELPDPSTWKAFAYAPGKLVGKTPPSMDVACTQAASTTVCVLTQPKFKRTVAVFTSAGADAHTASQGLKADPATKTGIIYEDGASVLDDPTSDHLATCDFVASSPAGLTAVTRTKMKGLRDPGFSTTAGIETSECLEAIAFAHALTKSP